MTFEWFKDRVEQPENYNIIIDYSKAGKVRVAVSTVEASCNTYGIIHYREQDRIVLLEGLLDVFDSNSEIPIDWDDIAYVLKPEGRFATLECEVDSVGDIIEKWITDIGSGDRQVVTLFVDGDVELFHIAEVSSMIEKLIPAVSKKHNDITCITGAKYNPCDDMVGRIRISLWY